MIYLYYLGIFLIVMAPLVFLLDDFPRGKKDKDQDQEEPEEEKSYEGRSIYDYTESVWGHAIGMWKIKDEEKGLVSMVGHGSGKRPLNQEDEGEKLLFIPKPVSVIEKGDLIRVKSGGGLTDFEVLEIKYMRDPKDQFSAELKLFGRVEENNA